jgi:ABC-type bacteriocin/lantibiotic exporter with double-glycine peptidase domain
VKAGEHLGIGAPLGTGKTTLARLLVRQMDPTEGQIWLGDRPLTSYSLKVLRSYVGYVPQEPVLFEGSVADNFRLVKPEASWKEIWQALEWAGLAEEVRHLPKGILTPIGEWGQQVSGGQRQRLALALTLIRRPQVLLLDDPFAPLDSQKIAEILEHLRRHFGRSYLGDFHPSAGSASLFRCLAGNSFGRGYSSKGRLSSALCRRRV